MRTDTSEKGLGALIVRGMTERGWLEAPEDSDVSYAGEVAEGVPFEEPVA